MRILHVIPTMDLALGGPANWTLWASVEAEKLGHVSEVATVDSPESAFLKDLPVTVHALGPVNRLNVSTRFNEWIFEHHGDYDFVVNHWIFGPCCYFTWKAMRGQHDRLVTFVHGFLDPYFNRAYPLKMVKKYLFWGWMVYPQLRDAAVTLFTTEEEKVLARQSFWPYRCNEAVIAYGITKPDYDVEHVKSVFRSSVPEVGDKPYLLYLSRIHQKKGVDLLLAAFHQVYGDDGSTMLVVAGPDHSGLVPGFKAWLDQRNMSDRVVWPGMLKGDMKWGAFEGCEAFVLPSHQENFGQVVAEAMSCGKPALISDKVNIHQEVSGSGGGLVESDSLEGTIRLLSRFKGLTGDERVEMGSRARACYHEKFELASSVEDFLRVLGDLAPGKSASTNRLPA